MQTPNETDITLSEAILADEKIVGSEEYTKVNEQTADGGVILSEWGSSETLYQELKTRAIQSRNYYLGEAVEQGVNNLEGNVAITVNIGATILDLFTYLLTNNAPSVQFIGDPDPVSQAEASFKETMTSRLLADANWNKKFRDAGKIQFTVGYTYLYPFWNKDNPLGGKKGSFDLTVLNPFTTRVKFKENDFEKPESFICTSRLSPAEIYKKYGIMPLSDSDYDGIEGQQSNPAQDDGMTTVYRRYGDKDIRVVINGRMVEKVEHNYGFVPLVPINNIQVLNDIHGRSEIDRWLGVAQEINTLLSAISEVARDLAYPPIIEYNNALGGQKPNKWRGMLIPAKRTDRGEGVEYLVNNAQLAPMIQQVKLLISLLHFTALMPEAAGGVFPANVTSGFQAKLSMQPATLTTDSRKIDWEWALKQIVKMSFKMLEKNDPSALKVTAGEKEVKITDIFDHEMNVVWPENLPIDIAREIQNLTLGLQSNLTSLHQAIDRYNVLMGMGTAEETIQYLKTEVDDPALSPDRALKVQEVQAKIAEILGSLSQMNTQLEQSRSSIGGGLPGEMTPPEENATNIANRGEKPEQNRAYPAETAREAVVPESTNGQVITPQK